MAVRADIALAIRLAERVDELFLGKNLFHGPVRAVKDGAPAEAVFVLLGGGPAPEDFHDTGSFMRRPQVQIRVRAGKGDGTRVDGSYGNGLDLARRIWNAVQFANVDGYTETVNLASEPAYLGRDKDGFHEWSMNAEMTLKEAPLSEEV